MSMIRSFGPDVSDPRVYSIFCLGLAWDFQFNSILVIDSIFFAWSEEFELLLQLKVEQRNSKFME